MALCPNFRQLFSSCQLQTDFPFALLCLIILHTWRWFTKKHNLILFCSERSRCKFTANVTGETVMQNRDNPSTQLKSAHLKVESCPDNFDESVPFPTILWACFNCMLRKSSFSTRVSPIVFAVFWCWICKNHSKRQITLVLIGFIQNSISFLCSLQPLAEAPCSPQWSQLLHTIDKI